ncbi:MAG: ABC transporter ATP-binding protein [Candidatus Thorarchaeota archaeon]
MTKEIQSTTEDQTPQVELTIGILINKLNRDSLIVLIRKFKNYLTRKLKASSFNTSEVNTFLFITCDFPLEYVELQEQRKTVLIQVEKILQDYCQNECSLYAKKIRQNIEIKDITKMLTQLVRNSKTENITDLIKQIEEKANDIDDRVIKHVSDVLLNSFITIWDFPKDQADIIMMPDLILKREVEDKESNIPLRTISENLAIMQFGKTCINNLNPMLESAEEAIKQLEILFTNKEYVARIKKEMTDKLWRILRVIFGLLSSTQQVVNILNKQIRRISEVRRDLIEQVEKLDYTPLMDYLMLLESTIICDDYISKLDLIQNQVKHTYQVLLEIINKFKDVPEIQSPDVRELAHIAIQTLAEIQLLKFYSDKFRDLAYFQTIPSETTYEKETEIEISPDIILKGVSLFKTYRLLGSTVYALRGVDLELKKGEMISIVGPSGSGKTTLLNLLSGLDTPSRGAVFLLGKNIDILSDSELSIFRRKNMGFIFQYYNLIPQLTVLENVMLPGLMIGRNRREVRKRALELIEEVELERFQNQFPIKLSGGQLQRVTIARAMINDPAVLFADEPTGDLDSLTGQKVIELISRFSKEKNTAVILVTHDLEMAKVCDKIVNIQNMKDKILAK